MPKKLKLTRSSALDNLLNRSPIASLKAAAPATRISLRARPQAIEPLSVALGLELPMEPKTSSVNGLRSALWLGPDEWLIIDQGEADLMTLCAAVSELHSATDVSHRNVAFLLSCAGATATLNAGCPQDLSLDVFPVGACTRTVFGKAEIVLHRTGEESFRVECWRSFTEYVYGLLSAGAQDASSQLSP